MTSPIRETVLSRNKGAGVTICLPGILARADGNSGQFWPIQAAMPGTVIGLTDAGTRADMKAMVEKAVEVALRYVLSNEPARLFGASMGAMVAPFVTDQFTESELYNVSAVLVDAPSGASTMKQAPNFTKPWMVEHLPAVGLPKFMQQPARLENITVPSPDLMYEVGGSMMSEEMWKERVVEMTRAGLQGHTLAMWGSQIAWMVRVGNDGTLAEACRSLSQIPTTYLACTGDGNNVVAQPAAAQWWQQHVENLRMIDVPATHCGFLENVQEFRTALAQVYT